LGALEEVMNIKLLERLREKESGVYSPGIDIGHSKLPSGRYHITIHFICAPANVDKLINATMDEINKIRQNGPQLVDIQKFQAEEKRSAEVYLKQNDFWSSVLLTYAQNDENPDIILEHIPNLQSLTVQNVKETANKYLNDANLIKLVLYPEKK
jgi:zinc protease